MAWRATPSLKKDQHRECNRQTSSLRTNTLENLKARVAKADGARAHRRSNGAGGGGVPGWGGTENTKAAAMDKEGQARKEEE